MEELITKGKEEVTIMILGDHSLCFEHLVRSYYNIKTGEDTKFVLEHCEANGVEAIINKRRVDVTIRVATTRKDSTRTRMDELRVNEYEKNMKDVDIILLCFYKNNSRTVQNVQTKYLVEIKKHFPKTPYYLVGVTIEELLGAVKQPLRETVSVQDRFLKREMDVPTGESKKLAKKIKACGLLECSVLKKLASPGSNSAVFEYDLEESKTVRDVIDKAVKFAIKRKNRTCILPFRR